MFWREINGSTGFSEPVIPKQALKWTQSDWQGKLVNTRTYDWESNRSKWVIGNSITLTHDLLGNLTQVQNQASGAVSTMKYDPAGRKIEMHDADLGMWTYAYDRNGNLKRQTDARGWSTCLYYDGLGRLAGKNFQHYNNDCAENATLPFAWDYTYGDSNPTAKRSWGQLAKVNNGDNSYSKELSYNELGLLSEERVTIVGTAPFVTQFGYDEYQRPKTTTYPDLEVVTVDNYNAMGLPTALSSSHLFGAFPASTLISHTLYDEAGRLTHLLLPSGGNLVRRQIYEPWQTQSSNGGLLAAIRVEQAGNPLLDLAYSYDSFGNIKTLSDNGTVTTFGYDDQNRLTTGYPLTGTTALTYTYDAAGRLTNYEGAQYRNEPGRHRVSHVDGEMRFGYDANGNIARRSGQNLYWDKENHLESVVGNGVDEQYFYDADGQRVKKVSGGVATFYPSGLVEKTDGVMTKYYFFNGQRVAMRKDGVLTYLHGDHLGSTMLATDATGAEVGNHGYSAYGKQRSGDAVPTDYQFTGQMQDASGLMYFNARV